MDALPKLNDVERLSTSVVRILGQNPSPYTLQGTNCYVIGTGSRRILLDTTSPTVHTAENSGTQKYIENLRQFLLKENAKITDVLVTHRHYDHVGAISDILHDADIMFDVASTRCSKYESSKQNEYTTPIEWHYITDREQFSVEGATLTAVHTPGHTDDHVSYVFEEENALFTGDTILGHGTTVAELLDKYIQSLELLRDLNVQRRFSRLYPAHGDIIDSEAAVTTKIQDYLKHRVERIEQILQCVQAAPSTDLATVDYLFDKVYPTVTGLLKFGAKNNLLQALQLLVNRGDLEMIETNSSDGEPTKHWRSKNAIASPSKL